EAVHQLTHSLPHVCSSYRLTDLVVVFSLDAGKEGLLATVVFDANGPQVCKVVATSPSERGLVVDNQLDAVLGHGLAAHLAPAARKVKGKGSVTRVDVALLGLVAHARQA